MTLAPSSRAKSSAPLNCAGSLGSSVVRSCTGAFTDGSTMHSTFRSSPTTSAKDARRISSLPDRINESRAPGLTIPMVIAFSSTERTCALAERSDQVKRRRFLTFSITSGHKRRSAAISTGPVGFGCGTYSLTGAGAGSFSTTTVGFTAAASFSLACQEPVPPPEFLWLGREYGSRYRVRYVRCVQEVLHRHFQAT